MKKYEISLIPNYGNDDTIIDIVKSMGIETSGKTRDAGFRGCDTPVILDIKCTPEQKDKLEKALHEVASDIFDVYERCSECGKIKD